MLHQTGLQVSRCDINTDVTSGPEDICYEQVSPSAKEADCQCRPTGTVETTHSKVCKVQ